MFTTINLTFSNEEMTDYLCNRGYNVYPNEVTTYTGPYGKIENTYEVLYANKVGSETEEELSRAFTKEFRNRLLMQ